MVKQPEPKLSQSSGKDDYLGLGDEVDPRKLLRYRFSVIWFILKDLLLESGARNRK